MGAGHEGGVPDEGDAGSRSHARRLDVEDRLQEGLLGQTHHVGEGGREDPIRIVPHRRQDLRLDPPRRDGQGVAHTAAVGEERGQGRLLVGLYQTTLKRLPVPVRHPSRERDSEDLLARRQAEREMEAIARRVASGRIAASTTARHATYPA